MPAEPSDPRSTRPVALRVAAVFLLLEAAAVVVVAILTLSGLDSARRSLGLTAAGFLILYGAGLVLTARGVSRAARWSLGALVLTQLIQLGLAWNLRGGATGWVSSVLAVAAVVTLVLCFLPASQAGFRAAERTDPPEAQDEPDSTDTPDPPAPRAR